MQDIAKQLGFESGSDLHATLLEKMKGIRATYERITADD